MPGLLDFLNTDDGRLGVALLSAAGPSMRPMGFGQRLQGAMQGLQDDKMNRSKVGLLDAQTSGALQQQQLVGLQAQALQRNNGIIGSILNQFTGQPPQPGQPPGAQPGGASPPSMPPAGIAPPDNAVRPQPTAAGLASAPQSGVGGGSMLGGLSPDAVAALKLAGVDLSDIYKYAHEPQKMDAGGVYTDRLTGKVTTIPSVSQDGKASQLVPDPTAPGGFRIIAPNGALGTYQSYADAGEAAKARFDPLDPKFVDASTGKPVGGSRFDYMNGAKASTPAIPVGNGVSLTPELRDVILADAAKNGISNPRVNFQPPAGYKTATFDVQGQSGGQGGVQLQSPAEAEGAKVTASKAAESGQAYKDALDGKVEEEFQLVNRNKQIAPLLDKFKTGGMLPDERLHFGNAIANTGMLPDSFKQPLASWIANGDPTAGKVIENQLASAGILNMLQTLDKEGKPNRAIFQAVQKAQEGLNSGNTTLKDVFELQNRLYGIHYNEQQALTKSIKDGSYDPRTWSGDYSAIRNAQLQQPAAPLPSASQPAGQGTNSAGQGQVFDKLPTANASNKGRMIRDTTTGKRLQSNGMSWVEVK